MPSLRGRAQVKRECANMSKKHGSHRTNNKSTRTPEPRHKQVPRRYEFGISHVMSCQQVGRTISRMTSVPFSSLHISLPGPKVKLERYSWYSHFPAPTMTGWHLQDFPGCAESGLVAVGSPYANSRVTKGTRETCQSFSTTEQVLGNEITVDTA